MSFVLSLHLMGRNSWLNWTTRGLCPPRTCPGTPLPIPRRLLIFPGSTHWSPHVNLHSHIWHLLQKLVCNYSVSFLSLGNDWIFHFMWSCTQHNAYWKQQFLKFLSYGTAIVYNYCSYLHDTTPVCHCILNTVVQHQFLFLPSIH